MAEDMNRTKTGPEAYVAFAGATRVASGTLAQTALGAKRALEMAGAASVLVFDAVTGHVADLDLRGDEAEVVARYTPASPPTTTRGRPKLGVVAREVTLLPRHWEWLAGQPGGASVALRKLVETARKDGTNADWERRGAEAAYRFMAAVAGDFPEFENASRALFANDPVGLRDRIRNWPQDVQRQVLDLLLGAKSEKGA
jgi:hypothetical protein